MRTSKSALVVFTLSPEAEGRRKPLGLGHPERAAAVYAALLRHLERICADLPGIDLVVATPERPLTPKAHHLPQRGADFGESLKLAVEDAFARGYERVVVIGNDAPEISRSYIEKAFARLEAGGSRAAVMGPARDGGYALLGLGRPCPEAFDAMPWGSRRVAGLTEERLRHAGFRVSRLATLEDIDTRHGLARFLARLHKGIVRELAKELARLLSIRRPRLTLWSPAYPDTLLVVWRALRAPPARPA